MSTLLTRLFPTPSSLLIPSTGLDFSDATLRFVELQEREHGIVPTRYEETPIPTGLLQGGRIVDDKGFTAFLAEVKEKFKLKYVRVAIPESQIYSFTLPLDLAAGANIKSAIELVLEDNIPLKAVETIFDYHILLQNEKNIVVQVFAISETVSRAYFTCFSQAGLIPISFELDGQAIARAVLPRTYKGSCMIVDFGAGRTSMSIVTQGTTVYTSTLDFGGRNMTETLAKELHISFEEAQELKHEYGIASARDNKGVYSVLMGGVSTLKDEINRRYVYWHEKKNQYGGVFPNIDTIYLCGGHSNLKGLADYLSVSLKVKVIQANPWVNCLSFDDIIPVMPQETSMSYVTAIGLVLGDYLYE